MLGRGLASFLTITSAVRKTRPRAHPTTVAVSHPCPCPSQPPHPAHQSLIPNQSPPTGVLAPHVPSVQSCKYFHYSTSFPTLPVCWAGPGTGTGQLYRAVMSSQGGWRRVCPASVGASPIPVDAWATLMSTPSSCMRFSQCSACLFPPTPTRLLTDGYRSTYGPVGGNTAHRYYVENGQARCHHRVVSPPLPPPGTPQPLARSPKRGSRRIPHHRHSAILNAHRRTVLSLWSLA